MISSPFITRTALMAAAAVTLFPAIATADVLVDNFESGNLISTSWSGEWYGTTNTTALTLRGLALRNANNGGGFSAPQFPSDKATSLTAHNGGLAFRYGIGGITAATGTVVAQRSHQTVVGLNRSTPTNVTTTPYLRFTAWRDPLVAAPGTGAVFTAIGTSADQSVTTPPTGMNPYGWNSFGPTDGNLANPTAVGVAITTEPKAFVIKLDDLAQFNVDKTYRDNVFLSGQTQQKAELTKLNRLAFGYYRTGTNAGTAMDPVAFFVDDIILNANPAGYVTTASLTTIDEKNSPTQATIDVVLNALPSHDVTLNVASSDITVLTVSASSLTFTTANWNVPQTITVTSVNDSVVGNPNRNASVQFSKGATLDLLYSGNTVAVPSDVNFTSLPVGLSGMSVE